MTAIRAWLFMQRGNISWGRKQKKRPRWAGPGPWPILLKDHTDAYISWEQFMKNQEKLKQNAKAGDA